MTKITYNKTITKSVKPTIVNLDFYIKTSNKELGKAINALNEIRKICKDFVESKKSYRVDSYKHENINVRKIMKTKIFYVDTLNPSRILSLEQICAVSPEDIKYYKKETEEIFDKYEVSISANAILDNSETVIEDFTDIVNMCLEKEISCTYNHTITKEERQQYNLAMYSECVNKAVEEVKQIIDDIEVKSNSFFEVSEISDNFGSSNRELCMADYGTASYKPEQYFIPELIKELFNNDIELTKSLQLTILF